MRPIKFRAKTLANGHWVYGSLSDYGNTYYVIHDKWSSPWVNPDTVGQFTGLRDRNGREIYEGDILNNYDQPNPLTVKWDVGNCRFALFTPDGDYEEDFSSLEIRLGIVIDAEIVGDIYQ